MSTCHCHETHSLRRVVITGGPNAGKTLVMELARRAFCQHLRVVPDASAIIFNGGFPRGGSQRVRRAAQRAILHLRHELELAAEEDLPSLILCDRGSVDGLADWPGPREDLWRAVGSSREEELARYEAVIHLHTPTTQYDRMDASHADDPELAEEVDERIARAWQGHPRRLFVDGELDILTKAREALRCIRAELPPCCRGAFVEEHVEEHGGHVVPWPGDAAHHLPG